MKRLRYYYLLLGLVLALPGWAQEEIQPIDSLKGKGKIVDGQREGRWMFFDERGQLAQRGEFAQGKQTGEWRFFNEYGGMLGVGGVRERRAVGRVENLLRERRPQVGELL